MREGLSMSAMSCPLPVRCDSSVSSRTLHGDVKISASRLAKESAEKVYEPMSSIKEGARRSR